MNIEIPENISGFAIVSQKKEYLYFVQVAEHGLETYSSPLPKHAQLFDTIEKAIEVAKNMINDTGEWQYQFLEEHKPLGVVLITIQVGEIEKL